MTAPPAIAIFGPTGVGKTAVAIGVADVLRARGEDPVAVSADALQVYTGIDTLTGAPDAVQRARLEHRLVGIVPASEGFSVGRYAQLAHAEIDALVAAGRRPLVVGGTGLYLRAALADLDPPPAASDEIRARRRAQLARAGPGPLHAELERRSPVAAARIDPSDRQRIVRALELLDSGERPPAERDSRLWTGDTRHPTVLVALVVDRAALDTAIDARVEAMLAAGAAEEVRRAAAAGVSPTARKALGFAELLDGDVDAMKRRTRRFARRQLTWLRKLPDIARIDVGGRDADAVAAEIVALADRRAAPSAAARPAAPPAGT